MQFTLNFEKIQTPDRTTLSIKALASNFIQASTPKSSDRMSNLMRNRLRRGSQNQYGCFILFGDSWWRNWYYCSRRSNEFHSGNNMVLTLFECSFCRFFFLNSFCRVDCYQITVSCRVYTASGCIPRHGGSNHHGMQSSYPWFCESFLY